MSYKLYKPSPPPVQKSFAWYRHIYPTKTVINDSNYIFTAESLDKGIVKYSDDKMDIYGKEGVNTGKHFMAIYKLEYGELSVCYKLKGDKYPEGYDTKASPLYFLSVFRKE